MNKFILITCILLIFTATACRKVIDIDLREETPSLVVEGVLVNKPEPYWVRLTTTKGYFDNGAVPSVSSAFVTISDDAGNKDTLYHTQNGMYQTKDDRKGQVGRTYYLNIVYDGKTYSASSTMPEPFKIDTLIYHEADTTNPFFTGKYVITMLAQASNNPNAYLQFKTFRNDTLLVDPFRYLIYENKYVKGNYIVSDFPYSFAPNDTVVEVSMGITREYFDYLTALQSQISQGGGPFDPPPANPPYNIKNGIGFWTTATSDTTSLRIK